MKEGTVDGEIEIRDPIDIANSLERCKGHYSFLIGAGTSKQAGIPTGGELVDRWRRQGYLRDSPNEDEEEIDDDDVVEWAEDIEETEMTSKEHPYGFWFEQQYTTRGERRQFIRNLVKDKDPTFGHIVLASLMKDGYVPLTLTPNFDDLLYDAFYLFHEDKPLMVDHNAVAPEFQLTQERPTIIKLHGDYLYDNLKNTNSETSELEKNMKRAVSRSIDEYGMVVVGYGGNDESIMNILNSESMEVPDYGLYWCTLDADNLSPNVEELLKRPNTFLVEIDGFGPFLNQLYSELENTTVPMPHEIKERAKEREQMLRERVAETEDTRSLDLFMAADSYTQNGDYEGAIDLYTIFINENTVSGEEEGISAEIERAYENRAMNYCRIGNFNDAIDDYKKVLESNEIAGNYLNLAEAQILNEDIEMATKNIEQAENVMDEDREAVLNYLRNLQHILEDDYHLTEEKKESLSDTKVSGWEFQTVLEALEYMSISDEKADQISDLIDIVRSPDSNRDMDYNPSRWVA